MEKFKKITAIIYFYPPSKGGASMPIFNGYKTVMEINNKYASVILVSLDNEKIIPVGKESKIDVYIPAWDYIKEDIVLGNKVKIMMGSRIMGEGTIVDRSF